MPGPKRTRPKGPKRTSKPKKADLGFFNEKNASDLLHVLTKERRRADDLGIDSAFRVIAKAEDYAAKMHKAVRSGDAKAYSKNADALSKFAEKNNLSRMSGLGNVDTLISNTQESIAETLNKPKSKKGKGKGKSRAAAFAQEAEYETAEMEKAGAGKPSGASKKGAVKDATMFFEGNPNPSVREYNKRVERLKSEGHSSEDISKAMGDGARAALKEIEKKKTSHHDRSSRMGGPSGSGQGWVNAGYASKFANQVLDLKKRIKMLDAGETPTGWDKSPHDKPGSGTSETPKKAMSASHEKFQQWQSMAPFEKQDFMRSLSSGDQDALQVHDKGSQLQSAINALEKNPSSKSIKKLVRTQAKLLDHALENIEMFGSDKDHSELKSQYSDLQQKYEKSFAPKKRGSKKKTGLDVEKKGKAAAKKQMAKKMTGGQKAVKTSKRGARYYETDSGRKVYLKK